MVQVKQTIKKVRVTNKVQQQAELVQRYLELQAQAKAIKTEMDMIKNQFTEELDKQYNGEIKQELVFETGHVYRTFYEKTTFDSKAFAEEHERMYKKYLVSSVQSKMEIKK